MFPDARQAKGNGYRDPAEYCALLIRDSGDSDGAYELDLRDLFALVSGFFMVATILTWQYSQAMWGWLEYLLKAERLIVIAIVILLTGAATITLESYGYISLVELPKYVRPIMTLVWVASGCLVIVRLAMAIGSATPPTVEYVASLPLRRRQRLADQVVIDRPNETRGVAREVLCYARYRNDNHIWVDDRPKSPRWLDTLLRAGLIAMYDAQWRVAHYSIHHVAWEHMLKYPNKFQYRLPWRNPPWTENFDERDLEREIEKISG